MNKHLLYFLFCLFCFENYVTAQNIGVGEASPASKLEVKGDSGTDLLNIKDQSDDSKFYIKNNGNVGIGTTSPDVKLHVNGATYLNVMPTHQTEGQIRIGRADDTDRYHLIKAYNSSTQANNYFTFSVHNGTVDATADVMTLKGNGNVGIGTTSPSVPLEVNKSIAGATTVLKLSKYEGDINAASQIYMDFEFTDDNANGTPQARIGAQANTDESSGTGTEAEGTADLLFFTASAVDGTSSNLAERMRIKATGELQFANYSNGYLQVDGSGNMSTVSSIPSGGIIEADPTWTGTANATGNVGRTGSVGIGVAVPTDKLDVTGNIAFTGEMKSRGANYTSTWMVFDEHQHGNSTIIGAGGLTVVGAGESPGQIRANVAANTETLHLSADGGIQMYTNVNSGWASRVNAMEILNTGDVLIEGGDVTIGSTASTTDKYLKIISREDAALEIIADDDNSGEDDNAYIYISQDDALVDGILGFSGATNVDPRGNAYTGAINNALLLGTLQSHDLQLGTNGNARMTISNAGDVAIGGATSASYKLRVYGKVRSDGINETSDGRFKKNVKSLENALDKVMAIRGVNYEWRTDEFPEKEFSEGVELGVIAQEIEKILPEIVDTDSEGYKSVQYSHIVPVLIEAVKELSAKLELKDAQHCAEIEQLQNKQASIIQSNEIEMSQMKAEMNSLKTEMVKIKELIEMSAKK